MAITDIIPWTKGREVDTRRDSDMHPFLALHREMNRMFDEAFRGLDLMQGALPRGFAGLDWPRIDIDETDKEIRITAVECPPKVRHTENKGQFSIGE
jgi:HSP20 family protein